MQLTAFMLQEAKVIKNACMALASIVEARGVLMTANCLMSSNLLLTRFGDLQQCAFNNFDLFVFRGVCIPAAEGGRNREHYFCLQVSENFQDFLLRFYLIGHHVQIL